jgi:hypothetical protein
MRSSCCLCAPPPEQAVSGVALERAIAGPRPGGNEEAHKRRTAGRSVFYTVHVISYTQHVLKRKHAIIST